MGSKLPTIPTDRLGNCVGAAPTAGAATYFHDSDFKRWGWHPFVFANEANYLLQSEMYGRNGISIGR
jgi:hypothetical protein